ncbi:uncharacterized protein LOC120945792 isoform X2 [Rana temporaria]|uniref:uncharacterized protein LOC120945792 isoform X2 n=1 Tax=Rana temporaria TaxID=8407 RepID=UPI001AAC4E24|nr:uncharacterized protein LOC120945792 isoform X2 [Rana temporaria]
MMAMVEFGYLLPAIGKYVCAYNKFQEDKNAKNYNAGAREFIDVLKCTGCQADKYIGGHALEQLLVSVGGTGSEALEVGIKILHTLGIDELKAKLICLLAGKLLQSPCLKAALVNIAPDILANLTELLL